MPKRNRNKIYGADQYYHLYNRGVNKQSIFHEPEDYFYFLSLFKRYLSDENILDKSGRPYIKLHQQVELTAFCLMPNHFHLLCFLKEPEGIVKLMQSVLTAYSMYFNKKYKRTGGLYEGPFLASRISNDGYLWHVSRYIHLNPLDVDGSFRNYAYSSIDYFAGDKHANWINVDRLVKSPKERQEYLEFVADYETMHEDMKLLKNILAA
ncbi:hypothetical protein BH10PAT4_BH10PAT4_2850 [soil metagenome]